MVIKKFLHSCILVEEGGKRLLADPGSFCFFEGLLKPEEVGPVDVMVFTHEHPDHYFPEAIKRIAALGTPEMVTHEAIGTLLAQEGLTYTKILTGEAKTAGGFSIKALAAPHGPLPLPLPHNLAYMINEQVLLPGDSYEVVGASTPVVLALPVAGPWSRLKDGLAFAASLQCKHIIPIHDAMIKDFFLERIYWMCGQYCESRGIAFHPLKLGESLEI